MKWISHNGHIYHEVAALVYITPLSIVQAGGSVEEFLLLSFSRARKIQIKTPSFILSRVHSLDRPH